MSRACSVSGCGSSSRHHPDKIFVQVPTEQASRARWLRALGRQPDSLSKRSALFVCEDHFDLQTDMENYLEYKMMGVKKRMRKDVVPHKFDATDVVQPVQVPLVKQEVADDDELNAFGRHVAGQLDKLRLEHAIVAQERIQAVLSAFRLQELGLRTDTSTEHDVLIIPHY